MKRFLPKRGDLMSLSLAGRFTYALANGMLTREKKKAPMLDPAWKGSRTMDMQSVWGNNFKAWRVSHEERLRREEEQEQAKQRQIMELLPLPRRAAPRLWEDLTSVLSRTARSMGYARPQWLLRPEVIQHKIDRDALPVLRRHLDSLLLSRLL